jgi:hypothetical protein
MARDILKYSRTMETPKEIALAATRGKLSPGQTQIKYCVKWLQDNPRGLVWCELKAFSELLAKEANVPYFCHLGKDNTGHFVEDHVGPCIVSPKAVQDGYNLQYNWNTNLIVSCPPNNEAAQGVPNLGRGPGPVRLHGRRDLGRFSKNARRSADVQDDFEQQVAVRRLYKHGHRRTNKETLR